MKIEDIEIPEGTALQIRILHNPGWAPQDPNEEIALRLTLFGPPPPAPIENICLTRWVKRASLNDQPNPVALAIT